MNSIDPVALEKSPKVSHKKIKIASATRSGSPGSVTRRVLMETDVKRDSSHMNLMVTGASINGSGLNIKSFGANPYALPV